MFFGFQLTCGLMMVFYGYTVMKNPRVWGEQGRRAVKAEHFDEYCRQNGLFFLKAGCIMSVIAALDALFTLNEGFSWPWPCVESEKKRIRKLRAEQEQQKSETEEK